MARPKKTDAPDLSARVNLSMGAIERLTCPPGKTQAFMRDTEAQACACVSLPPVPSLSYSSAS